MPATNLYNSISEAWAANEQLRALVPATAISQGRAEDSDAAVPGATPTELPFVVITTVSDTLQGRSSKARFYEELVQISCYVADLSIARQVQTLYRSVLDNLAPTLDDGCTLIRWERQSGGRTTEAGGIGKAIDTYVLEKQKSR